MSKLSEPNLSDLTVKRCTHFVPVEEGALEAETLHALECSGGLHADFSESISAVLLDSTCVEGVLTLASVLSTAPDFGRWNQLLPCSPKGSGLSPA